MIDLHTHILPEMDDGSRNVRESVNMLMRMKECGIDKVVATSHFYAREETPESFLDRRQESMHKLQVEIQRTNIQNQLPEVFLGAEVYYFSGISQCEAVRDLTIQGTNILLLELPYGVWNESILEEVDVIRKNLDLQVLIAHLDQYYSIGSNKKYIQQLLEMDVWIQVNIDAFLSFKTRWKARKLLHNCRIYALGSDAHNMKERAPRWKEFWEYIDKKRLQHLISRMPK